MKKHLSKGKQPTCTLASLQIYFMSIFTIPRTVRLRLEMIQSNYLWGAGAVENKIHLASGSPFVKTNRKEVWVLVLFLFLIRVLVLLE